MIHPSYQMIILEDMQLNFILQLFVKINCMHKIEVRYHINVDLLINKIIL